MNVSRRGFLASAGLLMVSSLAPPASIWALPPRRSVRDYGARGDGKASDTAAIQAAITAAAPGGVVFFPPGEYVSGTVRLRDRLVLQFAADATLVASPDDSDFDQYETPGYDAFADRETTDFHFALLQGHNIKHLTIVGPGRIDGNRRSRGGPKPIALKQCRHVRIQGLTIENAPNYNISLLGCDHVAIRDVTILNGYSDGIDPDCCRHVLISGCRVTSRDDAIVLKSSLALGRRRSTEDVVVTDCTLVNIRNGLKIGTESSGDFRRIAFRNCTLSGRSEFPNPPFVDLTPRPSAGVSLETVDGGMLEQVLVSGIRMTNVRAPIFVWLGKRGRGQAVPTAGGLRDVVISDLVAAGAEWTSSITGVPGHDVSDVALNDIRIFGRGGGDAASLSRAVPERERDYPDAARFRDLPAYGLYCRHVTRLRIHRATFTAMEPDARPAVMLDDARRSTVQGVLATAPPDGAAVAWLRSTQDCVVGDVRTPRGTAVIRVSGSDTARIRMPGAGPPRPAAVVVDPDVSRMALRTGDRATRLGDRAVMRSASAARED